MPPTQCRICAFEHPGVTQERTCKRTARKAHRQRRNNEKSDYKGARPKCDSLRRHEIYAGIGHNSNGKQHARNLADPARNNRNPHAPGKKIRKNKKARTRDKRSKEHCSVCEHRYRRRPHKQHYKTFRLPKSRSRHNAPHKTMTKPHRKHRFRHSSNAATSISLQSSAQ